jgi:hypothetical protein
MEMTQVGVFSTINQAVKSYEHFLITESVKNAAFSQNMAIFKLFLRSASGICCQDLANLFLPFPINWRSYLIFLK